MTELLALLGSGVVLWLGLALLAFIDNARNK